MCACVRVLASAFGIGFGFGIGLSVQGPKNTPETTVCPFNLQGLSGQNEDGGDATEEPVPDSSVSNVECLLLCTMSALYDVLC